MQIAPEPVSPDVVSLLEECGLPVADISPASNAHFSGIRSGGVLVAVIGLELHSRVGLLRSLAVKPSFRGRGLAKALVSYVESFAASRGVETLFLLTTTAESFFLALGYQPAQRASAPAAIRATSQFAGLCPVSSAFLSKRIAAAG